jgi:hypothetical protein
MQELRDDIKEHGQVDDIVIWNGKVLDGRRRQTCCLALDIEPRYTEFKGTEAQALSFIISKNLKRRHLGEAERAIVAAKIASLPVGRPSEQKAPGGAISPTIAETADLMNVSERAVDRARAVADRGTKRLQEAVRDGTLTLTDAAKVASEVPRVQDAAIAAVQAGRAKTASRAAKLDEKAAKKRASSQTKRVEAAFGIIVRFLDARGLHQKYRGTLEEILREIRRS